ncbi:MAG: hypothetical protein PVG39_25985 [Desulfobacteraceae bacterium]|jgi:hypothetical protein
MNPSSLVVHVYIFINFTSITGQLVWDFNSFSPAKRAAGKKKTDNNAIIRGLANAKTPIIMFSCYPKAKRRDCA